MVSSQRSEKYIVELMEHHPEEAFRLIYDLYAPRLVSISYRYIGDIDTAKDILQDALYRAYEKRASFKYQDEGGLWSWLKRIVVNLSLNHLKSFSVKNMERYEEGSCDMVEEDHDEDGVDLLALLDTKVLYDMIAELPEGYRAVFNLYAVEGYSHKEIAQYLGIAEKSSSSQYYRAKQLLKKRIEQWMKEKIDH